MIIGALVLETSFVVFSTYIWCQNPSEGDERTVAFEDEEVPTDEAT